MKPTLKNTFGAGLIALAFSIAISHPASAQSCAVPPTCEALGYTKSTSDCSGMSILKCPFDQNKIFCVTAEEVPGGSSNCNVGDILYSDKTCNANSVPGKFPIGVVFDAVNSLAIALGEDQKYWSTASFDIPNLLNLSIESAAKADWNGRNNTKVIVDYCKANGKSCPAAEYANGYTSVGTVAGDWYLPALGELNAIYGNKDVLNTALAKVNGTALRDYYYWSSSELGNLSAWPQAFNNGLVTTSPKNFNYHYVRPVLAF